MFKRLSTTDPFKVFYIVFAYVMIFSIWWGYLLYAKNETAFIEKIELNEVRYKQAYPRESYVLTNEYLLLHSKYQRQKLMIFLEGGVFLLLMIVGFVLVRRVFKKEIELAVQQRNFLHSITHELKSPLSTIKISLQTMLKRKLEQEQSEKLINNSLVDLDRLESLVDNILFAAKIEQSQHGFAEDDINLSELTQHLVERFNSNKKGIKITTEIQPDVYLHIDSMGYVSAVNNLVENAIKYSDEHTHIEVWLKTNGSYVELTVADTGIGIPDEEKRKVFDKFYRVGSEDTRKTKGTGLGLFIVKRFVEIYKGSISISDNKPVGSIFTLQLPMPGQS